MKKKLILMLLSALLVMITSCSSSDIKHVVKTIAKPKFQEETLSCIDSIIMPVAANVWHWKYSGNRLYTCTPVLRDQFLQVYSYPDFSLLYEYGSTGKGPDEFISVNWAKTNTEEEFILYDIMKSQLHVFKSDNEKPTKINSFSLYDGDGFAGFSKPFTMINKINDTVFLMKVNLMNQITLEIADLKNSKVLHSCPGSFVYDMPGLVGYHEFEIEYRDSIIVCAFHRINRIEISKIDKDYNIIKKTVIGDNCADTDQELENATKFYTDVKCEGNRIYTVFQGKNNNSSIEIYDLEGNAIRKLLLDHYIKIFFMSPDSNYLYGYYQTMDSDIILKYRLI